MYCQHARVTSCLYWQRSQLLTVRKFKEAQDLPTLPNAHRLTALKQSLFGGSGGISTGSGGGAVCEEAAIRSAVKPWFPSRQTLQPTAMPAVLRRALPALKALNSRALTLDRSTSSKHPRLAALHTVRVHIRIVPANSSETAVHEEIPCTLSHIASTHRSAVA